MTPVTTNTIIISIAGNGWGGGDVSDTQFLLCVRPVSPSPPFNFNCIVEKCNFNYNWVLKVFNLKSLELKLVFLKR